MERQPSPADDQAIIAIAQLEGRRWNRRLAVSLLLLVGLIVGYILSPGPFLLMTHHQSLPPAVEAFVQIIFAPLGWAMMKFPIVENFYKRYFELIGVDL